MHSVASFFVSRVDTEADKRLDEIGGEDELKGKLGDREREARLPELPRAFSGAALGGARGKGATKQRCLWASTSTKNPDYRDVMYVEELIGPETVNTMPEETIGAFQDHGEVAETLTQGVDEARSCFDELRAAGVDYDDVADTLERRACRSSPTRSPSCSRGSARSAASSRRA